MARPFFWVPIKLFHHVSPFFSSPVLHVLFFPFSACHLRMYSTPSTLQKRAREVEDEDEEDMVAALIAYADYTERCKFVCESVQRQCEEALNCYLK
jgi:hypothetical protein